VIGNLEAVVDWGYAPDYVRAFTLIMALEAPNDFVIATGIPHTVRDFAEVAFKQVGLDWSQYVIEDPNVLTRSRSGRVGDPSRLRQMTGWQPTIDFEEMVTMLVDQALGTYQMSDPKRKKTSQSRGLANRKISEP
jgi:GDPmannose 4,6-dehydratase